MKEKKTLLVCQQLRYGPNPECCGFVGKELLNYLQKNLSIKKLDIEVKASSCLLQCELGANIKCLPDNRMWHKRNLDNIHEVIKDLEKN
jgi:predicted metal-binding protein